MKCGVLGILVGVWLCQNLVKSYRKVLPNTHLKGSAERSYMTDEKQPPGCTMDSERRPGGGLWSTATELFIGSTPCQWVGREQLRC